MCIRDRLSPKLGRPRLVSRMETLRTLVGKPPGLKQGTFQCHSLCNSRGSVTSVLSPPKAFWELKIIRRCTGVKYHFGARNRIAPRQVRKWVDGGLPFIIVNADRGLWVLHPLSSAWSVGNFSGRDGESLSMSGTVTLDGETRSVSLPRLSKHVKRDGCKSNSLSRFRSGSKFGERMG